jgi:hypothetical protein
LDDIYSKIEELKKKVKLNNLIEEEKWWNMKKS